VTTPPNVTPALDSNDAKTPIGLALVYHIETIGGKRRRKEVLLISIPLCSKTKRGLTDTVESHVTNLPCVAAALLLSNTAVAVIPPEGKFDTEQVEAIVCNLATYRDLGADDYRIVRLLSKNPATKALRHNFITELKRAKNRAGSGNIPLELATNA